MNALLKVIFLLLSFFLTLFILVKITGILTLDQIENWLIQATQWSAYYVASIIVLLLLVDLFITVPTLSISILSGFFLGHITGFFVTLFGLMLAGTCGYALSRFYHDQIFQFFLKSETHRNEAKQAFKRHGFIMILLSRAMPMLPEASACLAGITRMKFRKFILAWLLSAAPYAFITSYAGSVSSAENPEPAIYAVIGIVGFLWVSGFIYHRFVGRKNPGSLLAASIEKWG